MPDLHGIASRHFPSWREAVERSEIPFAWTRRLMAAAVGQHLPSTEANLDYVDDIQRVFADPDFRETFLDRAMLDPIAGSLGDFAEFIKAEAAK